MKRKPRKSEFLQGVFVPNNPRKCLNVKCTYRSSWELKLMQWCDMSSNVIQWSSEKLEIPYNSPIDGKVHRYYPDAWIVAKMPDNKLTKCIVEVKPAKQSAAPKPSKRKKATTVIYEQATWAINQAKWKAAETYCNRRGYKFLILNEHHLGIKR